VTRLLAVLALVLCTAMPAFAQEVPPTPAPQPTPLAPPPPIVNVNPNVTVQMPDEPGDGCGWKRFFQHPWQCMTGDAKRSIEESRESTVQKFIAGFTSFLRTPDPFNSDRVRELWLWVGGPLALAIIVVLALWASGKGAVGNPHHMAPGELWGRALIALVAASASIIVIPWFIDMSNQAAAGMGFVPLDASLLKHGSAAGSIGVVDFIALLVLAPVVFFLLLFSLIRWVLVVIWCIVAPVAAATYTYPGTEDYALTYAKGLSALLGAPVIDAFLLSVMWWVVVTGHDIFPVSWGAWLDGLLVIVLALLCLIVELWALKTAFGIHNYSGFKRAMRGVRNQGVSIGASMISAEQDRLYAGARGRIGL
jgi:hypothetical protein